MNKEIKRICEEIENGNATMTALCDFYKQNYTLLNIVESLAIAHFELYKKTKEERQIPISKEDFLMIRNLFKIRGYKIMADGSVVSENRGGNRYGNRYAELRNGIVEREEIEE